MSPRPQVLFINRSYWPDAEATGQLLTELCEDLSDRFDVSVIAGQPNHNPELGEYKRYGVQQRNGVVIRRVLHTRLPKTYLLGRAINFLTFLIGAVVKAFTAPRADVVVVETDPPLLCILGAWIQWWRGSRLVVYLQDINPDIAVALGKLRNGWLTNVLRRRFAKIYRRADRVVVLSEDMRGAIVDWSVPGSQVTTIPNWVDCRGVYPVKQENRFRTEQDLTDKFVVMYSGNLGLCQQLEDVLQAAEQLRERKEIQFVLVGEGASKRRLQQYAAERRLENVRFLGYQQKSDLSVSLSAADVHLVPLDRRIVRYMMPSKLYGILASGTPVIAVAPEDCELSRLVREERVGFVTAVDNPSSLADQIRHCADNRTELCEIGARARALAEHRFDRAATTTRFGLLLSDVLGATASLPSASDDGECAPSTHGMRSYSATSSVSIADSVAAEQL
jgi:colanic acid biosynthesis glycosyl transferase WcaI